MSPNGQRRSRLPLRHPALVLLAAAALLLALSLVLGTLPSVRHYWKPACVITGRESRLDGFSAVGLAPAGLDGRGMARHQFRATQAPGSRLSLAPSSSTVATSYRSRYIT